MYWPLEYRRNLKDLVLILNARASHVDLGYHDFFRQTEIHYAYLAQNKTV